MQPFMYSVGFGIGDVYEGVDGYVGWEAFERVVVGLKLVSRLNA